MKRTLSKTLSLLLVFAMTFSLFTGLTPSAAAADLTGSGAVVGGDVIKAGGTYTVAADVTGTITVETNQAVSLVGTGITDNHNGLSIVCTAPGAALTISDLYISAPSSSASYNDAAGNNAYNIIRFTGTGNTLTVAGTNVLEAQTGGAAIHVAADQSLTVNGSGTLYLYKYGEWTAIGGDGSEANGAITIDMDEGKLFAKGSKMGAVIGSGSNCSAVPGDITIESGTLNLIANARGALIGTGSGNQDGTWPTSSGNVYLRGGSVNCNVDFTGAAIGASGGNSAPNEGGLTGSLVVTGGTLRVFIDENSYSYWGQTASGVSAKGITAAVSNGTNPVYPLVLDTSTLTTAASSFTVKLDGANTAYYTGGLHTYSFVNEALAQASQKTVATTPENWDTSSDSNLYLYLTGQNHTLNVNGETYYAVWNGVTSSFTVIKAMSHSITVDGAITGGTVGAVPSSAIQGETVTVTVTPDLGKKLTALTYTPEGGTATAISASGGAYSFSMPDKAVTVSAVFADVKSPTKITVSTSPAWTVYQAGESFDPAGMVVTATYGDNTTAAASDYTVTPSGALSTSDTKVTLSYTENGTTVTVNVPVTVLDTAWYGDGTAAAFTVSSKADLTGLANIVNGTIKGISRDDFHGKTVTLGSNIVLDADGKYTSASGTFGKADFPMTATYYTVNGDAFLWTPIGSGTATGNSTLSKANYFAGTFDGNNKSVSGLYTDGSATVQGLFGCVSGTVKNLTVSSGCVAAKFLAGGVCAYLNGGTIENCVNNAVVYADGGEKAGTGIENGVSRSGAIGGISGNAAGMFSITDCDNTGAITCTNTSKGGRAGGILGLVDISTVNGTVVCCKNTGAVNSYQYAGGIMGMNASPNVTIDRCFNTGAIFGYSSGSTYIGGIVASSNGNISNCYNTGNYTISLNSTSGTKAAHAGGIVSDFGGTVVTNCYDVGKFQYTGTASSSTSYGAICGSGYGTSSSNKLVNCYALNSTVGEDINNGCVTVKTDEEMKAPAYISVLCGSGRAFVQDTASVNGGYPVLRFQTTDTSKITTITKTSDPAMTAYIAGQIFVPTGLVLTAAYDDSTTEQVTDYTISKTAALEVTDTSVTVSGTHDGKVYSFSIPIQVVPQAEPPAISAQPQGATYLKSASATPLSVTAAVTDSGTLTYQWYAASSFSAAGSAIADAASVTYTPSTSALGGVYYYCIVTNTLTTGGISSTAVSTSDRVRVQVTSPANASAAVWDGTVDVSWYNTTDTTFTISTPAQLAGLAAIVNGVVMNNASVVGNPSYVWGTKITSGSSTWYAGTDDFDGKTIQLTADLDMGGVYDGTAKTWSGPTYEPIGGQFITLAANGAYFVNGLNVDPTTTSAGGSFCGTFNGNGHYIRNIYCSMGTGMSSESVGLIGRMGIHDNDVSNGINTLPTVIPSVRNVAVSGYIKAGRSVGGIVGKTGKTGGSPIIENCVNYADVTSTQKKGVGGICGASWNNPIIRNCYNTGTITGGSPAGGICGTNEGLVENCYNLGTVIASGSYSVALGTRDASTSNFKNSYALTGCANYASVAYGTSGSLGSECGFKTSTEMKTAAFVKTLGSAFCGDAVTAINGGYPVLSWQGGRQVYTVTLPSGTSYSAAAQDGYAPCVFSGDEFRFTVTANSGYALASVKAGTTGLSGVNGEYIIRNITADTSVSVATGLLGGGSGGGSPAATNRIGIDSVSADAITLSKNAAASGEQVTFTVKIPTGKKISSVTVKDASGNVLTVTENKDGTYSFTMPNSKITVSAVFADQESASTFSDIPDDAWYGNAVAYVTGKGLMNGTGDSTFSPQRTMTRTMLVTVLYRLDGSPAVSSKKDFSDVKDGSWYSDAVTWASANGIVLGYAGNTFSPDSSITRQQMAAILYRYAQYKGYDVSAGADTNILSYTDAPVISEYAVPAFQWACGAGVINGNGANALAPNDPATRAQVATIVMRFCQNVTK